MKIWKETYDNCDAHQQLEICYWCVIWQASIIQCAMSMSMRNRPYTLSLLFTTHLMRKFNMFIGWINGQSTSKQVSNRRVKLNYPLQSDDTFPINDYCCWIWSSWSLWPCCCWCYQHSGIKCVPHWNLWGEKRRNNFVCVIYIVGNHHLMGDGIYVCMIDPNAMIIVFIKLSIAINILKFADGF